MNTTANFFRKGEKRMGITAYLPVYWLIALVVFLVIEAATLGLATIWFAGGALVALIAAMCGAGIVIQIVLFLVVSLVLLFFTRPFAVRFLNKDTLKTNVDRVVGMEGVVTEELSNLANEAIGAQMKYPNDVNNMYRNTYNAYPLSKVWNFYTRSWS